MIILFWASLTAVFYAYLGYPLCLALLKRLRPLPVKKGVFEPHVTVVMAACNEEHNIARRLDNLLAQEYPAEKLKVVLVSDGSEDRTVQFASQVHSERVEIVSFEERRGKAAALNAGVARATGEIIVFCDARQRFEEDVIRQLVNNFSDESVGCVSGELMLVRSNSSGVQAELGAYWHYEKWIRKSESACGSVMGATGAIYAVRRSLYRNLPSGALLDDVMTPMQIAMQGYRVIFDSTAKAYDIISENLSQEWVRKVRTLAGNWQILSLLPGLLMPWRNPCCWRYFSHKILRLVIPLALLILVICGLLLDGTLYRVATWLQLMFYGLAGIGGVVPATRSNRVVKLSYFFFIMNLIAVVGLWRWVSGRSNTAWRPAYGKDGD